MLGFLSTARQKASLMAISAGLPGAVAAHTPVEKAAILVQANAMLEFAASNYDQKFLSDPKQADPRQIDQVLNDLLVARDGIMTIIGEKHAKHRQVTLCHLHATELVALSVGVGRPGARPDAMKKAWAAAWAGRTHVKEAVMGLRRYENATQVDAVPRMPNGNPPSDLTLLAYGQKLPEFLRSNRVQA